MEKNKAWEGDRHWSRRCNSRWSGKAVFDQRLEIGEGMIQADIWGVG